MKPSVPDSGGGFRFDQAPPGEYALQVAWQQGAEGTPESESLLWFTNLTPGAYRVFVWESLPSGGAELNAEFLAQFEAFSVPVTVAEGASISVRAPLIPAPR